MVQYIFTPWRDRRELLTVRRQFYPENHHHHHHQQQQNKTQAQPSLPVKKSRTCNLYSPENQGAASEQQDGKQKAVARVSMWMQRGGCPHMVESTALLTAAILSDEGILQGGDDDGSMRASRGYAVRAAYSAAFSR
jgi:ribosomal biogenesis protein LAS1